MHQFTIVLGAAALLALLTFAVRDMLRVPPRRSETFHFALCAIVGSLMLVILIVMACNTDIAVISTWQRAFEGQTSALTTVSAAILVGYTGAGFVIGSVYGLVKSA